MQGKEDRGQGRYSAPGEPRECRVPKKRRDARTTSGAVRRGRSTDPGHGNVACPDPGHGNVACPEKTVARPGLITYFEFALYAN
jgi:hypothetical protein